MAPLAIQETKASARRWIHEGSDACIEALAPTQAKLMATEDAKEGVASFVERRSAEFKEVAKRASFGFLYAPICKAFTIPRQ